MRRDVRGLSEDAAVQRLVDALRQREVYLTPQYVQLLARHMSDRWQRVRHPFQTRREARNALGTPDPESARFEAQADDVSRRVGTLASDPEIERLSVSSARTFDGIIHVVEVRPWSPEVATRIVNAVAPLPVEVRPEPR